MSLFCIGIVLYKVKDSLKAVNKKYSTISSLSVCISGVRFSTFFTDISTSQPAILASLLLPIFICLILFYGNARRSSILSRPYIVYVGKASYSIYIWHGMF